MNPADIAVVLDRVGELVASKNPTSQSLTQVADELRRLELYCKENYVSVPVGRLRIEHLREGKYKC